MDLILWRHCEAASGVPDELRPLTPLGGKQATRMARWLNERVPAGCRIIVSPALRAQQTAQALDRKFETVPEIGPGASVAGVLAAANWPEAREPVLVVGHQPTLGRVASFLVAGDEMDQAMRTGAVWWLSNGVHQEPAAIALKLVIDPDYI
jgi:phosphohistidine phosphatase